MKNMKAQIVAALREVTENVVDQYPKTWEQLPVITVIEEENKVYEATERESKSQVRYRIDIWNDKSTSSTALDIDAKVGIKGLGLYRTSCSDAPDPSGLKHKVMRYEGILDEDNDFVEWMR